MALLALLETSGRVQIHVNGQLATHFDVGERLEGAKVAIGEDRVFVLRAPAEAVGLAVSSWRLDGTPAAAWGDLPDTVMFQNVMGGGGIAYCGHKIYFSHSHSSVLSSIDLKSGDLVEHQPQQEIAFRTITKSEVREVEARMEALRRVSPLTTLGLAASRVVSVACSDDALLRQISPGKESRDGPYIEVWNARDGQLRTLVGSDGGTLLGSHQGSVILGFSKDARREMELSWLRIDELDRPAN